MEQIYLGKIGVDSGQMMLVDPGYVAGDAFDEGWDKSAQIKMQKTGQFRFNYNGACALTNNPGSVSPGGILQNDIGASLAAVVSSGFGDGTYDVFAYVGNYGEWGKRVAKLEIIFIDEEEKES